MLRLRPFKPSDAEKIVTWCQDEKTFLLWGGALFGQYPIPAETMINKYLAENGGCEEPDNFYPVCAADEEGIAGHLILRYLHGNHDIIRLGWVILDPSRRGQGYGKEMIYLAMKYAFLILNARKVSIGVFDNNPAAYHCYLSCGFHKAGPDGEKDRDEVILGEPCRVVELEITKGEWLSQIVGK
ncbi:MAG: GNAT family N-acetyltransferase [Clostridiales bacterium]|nr:GNAT family N-acetyltransferase [Clostridiales bacterium]